MTDHDIIFGVVNKLDRKQYDITIIYKRNDGAYLEVYKKSETKISFEFDKEGNLTNI